MNQPQTGYHAVASSTPPQLLLYFNTAVNVSSVFSYMLSIFLLIRVAK